MTSCSCNTTKPHTFQAAHGGPRYHLGRRRPSHRPLLRYRDYADTRALSGSSPTAIDQFSGNTLSEQDVYLNDQLGDCCIAAGYHCLGVWTGLAGSPYSAPDSAIVGDYSAACGYRQGRPWTDQGCDEISCFNLWSQQGFANGDKLFAFTSVDPTNQAEVSHCIYTFGCVYLTLELPSDWIGRDSPQGDGFTWDLAGPPNPNYGHAIMAGGYDSTGITVDTWGMTGTVTWKALAYYMAQSQGGACYGLLSRSAVNHATQLGPTGVDWPSMLADFQALGPSPCQ